MFLKQGGAGAAGTRVRLAVVSLGVVAVSGMPAHARAEPAPSARDVERSRAEVRERAAEVGRTKAELARAGGELERLAADSALAVERLHGEQLKLERSRVAYRQTLSRVAEADRRVREVQGELAAVAADAYRLGAGRHGSWPAVLAGRGGPQGFMDRAGLMEMLARRRAGAVQQVEAAREVAELFRRQAREALDDQARAAERAKAAEREAARAVAGQRAAVRRIEARKRRLEERLGGAQARAAQLRRQRQAALERAEERRLRRAAERSGAGFGSASGSGVSRPAGAAGSFSGATRGSMVARAALRWLGTPYSWGGGTASGPSYGIEHGSRIHGFDCSGLALYAWAKAGVRLDHWTGTQWTSGPRVPLNRLRPGDLVFFAKNTSDPGTIHHVGIYLREGRMVEAPYTGARVRVSSIYRNGLIGAVRPAGR
ncbi:NlpC/P60 family protein [Actinomadura viridis]|uniref:C40 family peptidase n=1 Tax=Actinomadura viridis TaxID=58110 RepID=UPI0036961613